MKGNRYVLVMTDYLSKYVWAKPMSTCTARDVAQFVIEKFEFGVPSYILTDCGTHFHNELFRNLTQLIGTNHILTTPYHAQSNGQVERWNASMRPKLFALAGDHPENWDQFVPAVVNVYDSGRHASTGIAPSTLMFARDIRLPFDPPRPRITMYKPSDYWEFVQEFRRGTTQAVRANVREHQQQAKKRFDKNRQDISYLLDEPVFLRRHGAIGKGGKLFDGPFFVVQQRGTNTYLVRGDDPNNVWQVHASDMEPFAARSVP